MAKEGSIVRDPASLAAILLALALTVLALIVLPGVETSSEWEPFLPESDEYVQRKQAADQHFASGDFILVTVESDKLFHVDTMRRVNRLTEELSALEPVASAHSLTTVRELTTGSTDASREALIDLEAYDASRTRNRVLGTELYRSLFLANSETAQVIYLVPKQEAETAAIARAILGHPEIADNESVFAYGEPILAYLTAQSVFNELFVLTGVVLGAIFLVSAILYRRILIALLIGATGCLPGLWMMAVFPLLGLKVTMLTTLAPVMTILLATTYALHVIRRYRFRTMSHAELRRRVGPIVLAAAGTTAAGMLSLLVTPFPDLHILAGLVVSGVVLAALCALFLLPQLAKFLHFRSTPFWDSFEQWVPTVEAGRTNRLVAALVVGVIIVGAVIGIPRITYDYRLSDILRPGSPLHDRIERFAEVNGGPEQLVLVIDTGEKYGLVSPDAYSGLVRTHSKLSELEAVTDVVSITPFVGWINGRLEGTQESVQPKRQATIGESLELLSSSSEALSVDSLIDANWRRARMLIRFGDPSLSTREAIAEFTALESEINRIVSNELPEAEQDLFGVSLRVRRNVSYHRDGMLTSILFFFAIVGTIVGLAFRSVRWTLIVLLPTVLAVLFYFGVLGWFTIPLSPVSMFTVALLLGVSNDDVLYFAMTFRQMAKQGSRDEALRHTFNHSGVAIVQTTLLITAGCAVMLVSENQRLALAALVFAVSLIVSTGVTLSLIPRLLYNTPLMPKESEENHAR
jgi:predicted RND superfamily exporter protein